MWSAERLQEPSQHSGAVEFNGMAYLDPGADAEVLERFRSRGSTSAEIGDIHEDGHMIGGC